MFSGVKLCNYFYAGTLVLVNDEIFPFNIFDKFKICQSAENSIIILNYMNNWNGKNKYTYLCMYFISGVQLYCFVIVHFHRYHESTVW